MRLSRSFVLKLARSVGACMAVLAVWGAPGPYRPDAGGCPGAAGKRSTPGKRNAPGKRTARARRPRSRCAFAVCPIPARGHARTPYRLTPVTDEMLRNPPPGDWLHWRRTYDGWAHSPLTQINRNNVKDLKVAWTWGLASANGAVNEFTPLVHDGIMFMWNFGDTIQALNAKTGTLLWQYEHELPKDYPSLPGFYRTKRSLAIGGNKLIVPTIDMRVIALDVKTGKKLWDISTDDYKRSARTTAARWSSGTRCSSAPATVGRAAPISKGVRWQAIPRRADASSPATTSRRERNCGGSTRSRTLTSRVAIPGTICRTKSAAAAPSGRLGSTTRS